MRDYELMYIVRPDLDDEALKAAVDSVQTLIEGQGGEVAKTTMWGKRRLAYEVKDYRDGHYVILHTRLEGDRVRPVEAALRIHETVFRHLLVRRDEVADGEAEDEVEAESDGADPRRGANGSPRRAAPRARAADGDAAAAAADGGSPGGDDSDGGGRDAADDDAGDGDVGEGADVVEEA